ncbi:hypothetical protein M8542_14500 [Amycolatopsis sp. OK19-0408]|uniref:Uncharacterized protein n=1 Tax=Amycolatopsis iheyensis TaxID=2945988 RepID=A0A9X2SKN1_9PSEU|nr:hypothetical protein [Amycolatopsis iheyensis]MCR6484031.1 hypothetical protein [Amycolatopsis iheyensis]
MPWPLLLTLSVTLAFLMGVLCGGAWSEQRLSMRTRRLADLQREVNEQAQALRKRQVEDARRRTLRA